MTEGVVRLECAACGGELAIPRDDFNAAVAAGEMIPTRHAVCPEQANEGMRTFRVRLVAEELILDHTEDAPGDPVERWEELAWVGARARAPKFRDALLVLSRDLNEKWNELVAKAEIADAEESD